MGDGEAMGRRWKAVEATLVRGRGDGIGNRDDQRLAVSG
ncbi:hypothetical protein X947_3233 [Burkholderia pseudomallei MSHR7334]|nr:hypothetical protein X947_3233 [Burkholderia pseudomallei MSHR7334]